MKTLLIPKFDINNNFTEYKRMKVKDVIDHSEQMRIIAELPGIPQGFCPALGKILTTKEPIEIRRFYDSRQNTRKLKGYFIPVVD